MRAAREQRRDRQQASAVDDGDAVAGHHAAGGQGGRALPDRRRQLAVADGAPVDDERGPGGIACRGGLEDLARVHGRA